MLLSGLTVAFVGMVTVFTFLGLVVALIELMAFVMKFFPEEPSNDGLISKQSNQDEEIALAIAAARIFSGQGNKA